MTATNSTVSPGSFAARRARAFARGAFSGLSLLLAFALSVPAHAESNSADSDRANLLFKKGKVAFNDGKFDDALRIYSEAWRLKQSPDIAANLAQTESELGKHRDAAEHFAFALAHLLPSTTDEQKKALADGLTLEKKEVGTLHVTLEPAEASLSIDDSPVTLPPSGDLFVAPGEHRCSVTREGYAASQQAVRVSKGASQVLWIRLAPAGSTAAVVPTPGASNLAPARDEGPPKLDGSTQRSLVPAFIGGGLVVAGAAVGVAFMLSANSSQADANQIKAELSGQNPCGADTPFASKCSALHDKNSSIDSARRVEVVGFTAAGVAAVGTALYLLWPRASESARAWSPTFAWVPGAESVGFFRRF
jgi:tetratricopeptide (TPR) repeat protein